MQTRIFCRRCIVAIVMISAAAIGVLENAGTASVSVAAAAELTPSQTERSLLERAQTKFYINTPSIHDSVMNELIQGRPEDADTGRTVRRLSKPENSPAQDRQPTSMLWPAYKYLPQLGNSFAA